MICKHDREAENRGKQRKCAEKTESEGWLKRSYEKRLQCRDTEAGTWKVCQSKVTGRGYVYDEKDKDGLKNKHHAPHGT